MTDEKMVVIVIYMILMLAISSELLLTALIANGD
jgi:hypothetical protein